MPDRLVPSRDDGLVIMRYRDMLDGTFAPITAGAVPGSASGADGVSGAGMQEVSIGLWNGANFDRMRANFDTGSLLTMVNAAAGANGPDQVNINARGVQLGLNITAASGTTPTIQLILEGRDIASGGVYYTLFASAVLTAAPGFTLLSIYPGLAATSASSSQVLPRTWRVRSVIGGTTPAVSATVGSSIIL